MYCFNHTRCYSLMRPDDSCFSDKLCRLSVDDMNAKHLADIVVDNDLDKSLDVIRNLANEIGAGTVESDPHVTKVSVIGVGMRSHTGVANTTPLPWVAL